MSDTTDIAARRRQSRVLVGACLLAAVLGFVLTVLVAGRTAPAPAAPQPHLAAQESPARNPGTSAAARATTPPSRSRRAVEQQLLTVTAPTGRSTRAWVQRWTLRHGRWVAASRPVGAAIGADGVTAHPVEGRAATPLGVFTLTDAFGAGSNRGDRITRLAYRQSRYGDSWGSDPRRPTYNRLWNCGCGAGELYRLRSSYFRYGIVIDYNRSPVVRGAGSGFFVHVADGRPTGGCVALHRADLVAILRWLDPAARPRIAIRVGPPGRVPTVRPAG